MSRTPGFVAPQSSSAEDLAKAHEVVQQKNKAAGFKPLDLSAFVDLEQSDMNDPVEAVLEHFGVKGMKWGIRKTLSTSDDAAEARGLIGQGKIGGVTSLSNEEIQKAIKRMNLEAEYKKAHGDSSLKQKGLKFVGKLLLNFGKDYISSYIKHPAANAATGGNFAWAYAGARTIDGIVVNNRKELGS